MRNCIHYILFCLISVQAVAQTNRALFVAIDQYAKHTNWGKLNCSNDYYLLEPILKKDNFLIETLINEKATKANIVDAFKRLQQQISTGDYIYIHFSCHGQLMADDNFDEEDGWDEAIVAYDAYHRYMQGQYEGEKHLRDDELETYLNALRFKAGTSGNVTLVVDACHSGTINRDEEDEYIRGTAYPFDKHKYTDKRDKSKQRTKISKDPAMSPLCVITACQTGESNLEYMNPADRKYYGALSWALKEILTSKKIYSVSEMIVRVDKIIKDMQKERKHPQTPYLESSDVNNVFKISR